MARGDIRSGYVSVPATSWFNVQPPAGEHWMLKNLVSEYWGTGLITEVALFNGSITTQVFTVASTPPAGVNDRFAGFWTAAAADRAVPFDFLITNSLYLRMRNASGSAVWVVYTALQIN